HAPGSTDEQIARGDAPYIADGSGEPSEQDYAAAFAAWRKDAIAEAADHLDTMWDDEAGRCVYYADETSSYYVCEDEDEMLWLWTLLHTEDDDIRRDAYSHWCAGTKHSQCNSDGSPLYTTRVVDGDGNSGDSIWPDLEDSEISADSPEEALGK